MAGNGFLAVGRTDLAIATHEKALSFDPDFLLARLFVASSYARASRLDEAVASLEEVVELGRRAPMYVAVLGLAYGASGRTGEAEALLAGLEARAPTEYVSPLCFADVLLGLGRKEEAVEWLEKAYVARSPALSVFFSNVVSLGVEASDIIEDYTERIGMKAFVFRRRDN